MKVAYFAQYHLTKTALSENKKWLNKKSNLIKILLKQPNATTQLHWILACGALLEQNPHFLQKSKIWLVFTKNDSSSPQPYTILTLIILKARNLFILY